MSRWLSRMVLVLPALAIVAVAVAINVWVVSHPKRIDLTSGDDRQRRQHEDHA